MIGPSVPLSFGIRDYSHMRKLILLNIIFILSGCSILDKPKNVASPTIIAPEKWSAVHLDKQFQNGSFDFSQYPQLVSYINEALINNPALIETRLDVDNAVAIAKQVSAQEWPQVEAFLSTGRQKASNNISNSNIARIDISWNIDFLNKLDDLSKASTLDARQSVLAYNHQQNETVALISQQWFELIFAQQQYQLIKKRTANLQQNLEIIESGYTQGVNQSLDVYLARADLAKSFANAQENLATLKDSQRSLEISLGRYPSATIIAKGDLTFAATAIPTGLPSELLLRRFDIQQANLKLTAENYRLSNAYKNRFPSLSLSASGGQSSPDLKDLLSAESLIWSLFVNASAPIFDAGNLEAKQQQQLITAKKAANKVTSTTLQAFIEIENTLSAERTLAQQEIEQRDAKEYFATAEQLAFEQYIAGLSAYITVLESQRSAYDAQTSLLAIKNARIQNRIQLLLALGGDLPQSVTTTGQIQATHLSSEITKDINSVSK